jgi:hypothetical protein
MTTPPYAAGDRIVLGLDEGPRSVIVSALVSLPAPDPSRRWRLLCRDAIDGSSIELPVYCGEDGVGDLVRGRETPISGASA